MEDFTVQEVQVSLVSPSKPFNNKHIHIPFTTFDIMQKRSSMPYLQRVCFFPSTTNSPDMNTSLGLINSMKQSLADVLIDFYPLAGRLSIKTPGARPEISCNDAGVEFCVAEADVLLSDLDYSQPQPWFSKLIQRGNYEYQGLSTDIPFLTIQVTTFKCGSVCVAWSYDHLVMDGSSQWHFMTSWSEVCRGLELSLGPTHGREFESEHDQFSGIQATPSLSYVFEDVSQGMEARIFEFDEDFIQRLKLSSKGPFSAFEVVASHVWITLCKARQLPGSQRTSHQLPMNCRGRLDVPLPAGYFGNCVLCAFAESTAGEVISGGVPFTAQLVHEAIRSFQSHAIRSKVEEYNANAGGNNPFSKGVSDGVDTWGGSSHRFPMYGLDFGWGRPAAVRHARKLWNGFCFYDPSPRGGKAIEVTVFLPPEKMFNFHKLVYNI